MLRTFLGRHPLLSSPLLLAPQLAALIALDFRPVLKANRWAAAAWVVLFLVWPLCVALLLTCLRRRAGLSSAVIWGFVTAVPTQLAAHIGVWESLRRWRGSEHGFEVLPQVAWLVITDSKFWSFMEVKVFLTLGLFGSLFGTLLGLAIARWKLRTGRWEHIVPVEKPGKLP